MRYLEAIRQSIDTSLVRGNRSFLIKSGIRMWSSVKVRVKCLTISRKIGIRMFVHTIISRFTCYYSMGRISWKPRVWDFQNRYYFSKACWRNPCDFHRESHRKNVSLRFFIVAILKLSNWYVFFSIFSIVNQLR